MPLQSSGLVMSALGVLADQPPSPLQPELIDGMHLRWAFERSRGFPWHGFYLFRRHHRPGIATEIHPQVNGLPLGPQGDGILDLNGVGRLRSDQELVVDDTFAASGGVSLSLAGRRFLRFSPTDAPAFRVELTVGFVEDAQIDVRALHVKTPVATAHMRGEAGTVVRQTLEADAITDIEIAGGAASLINLAFVPVAQGASDDWKPVHDISLPMGLPLTHPDYPLTPGAAAHLGQARSAASNRIVSGDAGRYTDPQGTLAAAGTVQVANGSDIVDGLDTAWSPELAGGAFQIQGDDDAYTVVEVISLTQLRLSRAYAGPTTTGASYAIQDDGFAQLHDALVHLVAGGPAGGPMADRSMGSIPAAGLDAGGDGPELPGQRPLDLVLLSALEPAFAQMMGLYFVDQSAQEGEAYDYLIVADDTGSLEDHGGDLAQAVADQLGTTLDGFIVFNRSLRPSPALAPPADVRVYALPDSGVNAPGTSAAGLTWAQAPAAAAQLPAEGPILYHLWRADLGDAAPAAVPPPPAYELLSAEPAPPGTPLEQRVPKPLFIARPSAVPPQRPQNWPPHRMLATDGGLADGWYSYRVSAIDLFGRHSALSEAGAWYQWQPEPEPKPWYFQTPPGDRPVHPHAAQLLDKTPPPPPTGIEAFALDPNDPTAVRDAAYESWRASLPPEHRDTTVGLRVRWAWTAAQARQAPDTQEFRIYSHPGVQPPEAAARPAHWDARIHVVDFDEHVAVGTDAAGLPIRRYEIFLPRPGDAPDDLPTLTPSLQSPVVYANVGVSAADSKAHSADDPRWDGTEWGSRPGNEGALGAAATVFCVLRDKPERPAPPPADGDAAMASAADYHGHSYYTYRWLPRPHLKAHILRALDHSVFSADWALRPRGPLDPDDASIFPSEADEPRWDGLKRQQVADALAIFDTFPRDAAGKRQAMAAYEALSNDALRILAGLAGVEKAFTQLTVRPLDADDPEVADRPGPDNPPDHPTDPALRIFVDTLNGRCANRYFYRAAYVDGAHNRSGLSLAGPPVCLPAVVPPVAPSIISVTGGDRQIELTWASGRERDLAAYRVYRASDAAAAADLRTMEWVHTEPIPPGPADARPKKVTFTDLTVVPYQEALYRVVAVDSEDNASAPSTAVTSVAYDYGPPAEPQWERSEWVKLDDEGNEYPLDDPRPGLRLAIALALSTEQGAVAALIERSSFRGWRSATPWLKRGQLAEATGRYWFTFYDRSANPSRSQTYRPRLQSSAGIYLESTHPRAVAAL